MQELECEDTILSDGDCNFSNRDLSKKRVRKQNFSDAEITCLLIEVKKHYRFLQRKRESLRLERQKKQRWQIITEKVNKVTANNVKRSWKEVKNKFLAMKALALAMREGKQPWSKETPHVQAVVDIIDGLRAAQKESQQESGLLSADDIKQEPLASWEDEGFFSSHKRERKANYTIEEMGCMLEVIHKHKDVLIEHAGLQTKPFLKKKLLVWRLITDKVNKCSENGARRTAKELKKKWWEMRFLARKHTIALSQGKVEESAAPPYYQKILDILQNTGSASLGTASNSEESQEISGFATGSSSLYGRIDDEEIETNENIKKVEASDECDDNEAEERIELNEEPNHKDTAYHNNVHTTNRVALLRTTSHRLTLTSEKLQDSELSDSVKKRERKPNFTEAEVCCMLEMFNANKAVLNSKRVDSATNAYKQRIWQYISDCVNRVPNSCGKRTPADLKKKWTDIKFLAMKTWIARCDAITQGKSPPKESTFMQKVISIVIEDDVNNQALEQYQGKETDESIRNAKGPVDVKTLVQRHIRTLSLTCAELRALGVETGSMIMVNNAVLSCGNEVTSLIRHPQVLAVLNKLPAISDIKLNQMVDRQDWKVTPLIRGTDGSQTTTSSGESSSQRPTHNKTRKENNFQRSCTIEQMIENATEGFQVEETGSSDGDKIDYRLLAELKRNLDGEDDENIDESRCPDSHKSAAATVATSAVEMIDLTSNNPAAAVSGLRIRRFGCGVCGKRFFTSYHRKQHFRIHTGERPFKCDICGLTFAQSTSLVIHKRKHTGERPYACDMCGHTFYSSSDVLKHKRRQHGLVTKKRETGDDHYRCDICGKIFLNTTSLVLHKRVHTGERPFACDQCDQRFPVRYKLLRHKERHLGIKAIQCEVCSAKFTEKAYLKVHMRIHTGEKPFKCEFCGEGFYITSALKIHRRRHTGERPFLCDLCGASFMQGGKLNSHRRKHTGERPYKCQECGETFREKTQLNIHQRKHTGEEPYQCTICGKALRNASHLAVHVRLHTGEKPFRCDVCGDSFARSDVMKLHMKKHSTDSFANIPKGLSRLQFTTS